jgi:hypothetical protein
MSYLEQSKQNAAARRDSQELAAIKEQAREDNRQQNAFAAVRDIEQRLAQKAGNNQELIGQAVQEGYWQPNNDPKGGDAAVARMLFDRNAQAREAELRQILSTRNIVPQAPAGLADTFKGIGL